MLRGIKLDTAVIESTCGFGVPDSENGHLGVNTTVRFRDKLLEMGCISENTPVYVNHFSHNGNANHDELVKFFQTHNMTVTFDGLAIDI
jgi:phosphoribosyl 1,2-cyclic phosphate phosphodiesterase